MNSFNGYNSTMIIIIWLCWIIFGALGSFLGHAIYDKVQGSKRKKNYQTIPRLTPKAVTFKSQKEANEAFHALKGCVWDYGCASVSDLYNLVGVTPNYKDNKYGWTDLRGAYITKALGGFRLNLPKAIVLGDMEIKYEQRV